jgi:hypothetical protein
MDVTHGVLYLVVSVPDPRKAQTLVVNVHQDAAGTDLRTPLAVNGQASAEPAKDAACRRAKRVLLSPRWSVARYAIALHLRSPRTDQPSY